MTFTEKYIDRFVNETDKQNPETFRKARFFIISELIILFLVTASTPYLLLTLPSEAIFTGIVNVLIFLAIVTMIFLYKKYGKRIFWVNFISVLLMAPFIETYTKTGGIYSSDNLVFLVVASWIFLVANKQSGIAWFLIGIAWCSFLFYANQTGMKDFISDFKNVPASYHYYNYLMSGTFLIIIIFLYEQGKEKYLKEVIKVKTEIENQKKELESKNKDITDSINYAKRIQNAVLPNEETINRNIPLSFIFYRPRDIVSGDFYWFHEIDRDNYIIVCGDCTGHGVPGALMTVIGTNLLNQTVIDNKITEPSKILFVLDNLINITLKQQKEHEYHVEDGMDLALLKVDKKNKEFIFSSARRPGILIREKQMQDLKADKFNLGGMITGCKVFQETKMNFHEDDILYLYTDGYPDQFGGPKGKKFSTKQFKETLLSVHRSKMEEQKRQIENVFEKWKSIHDQVDDILVMGIKF